jgi:hypothetical protein
MAAVNDKWIDIVAALIKLTQMGQLVWRIENPSDTFAPPDRYVEVVYITEYKNSVFRLYEEILASNRFQHSPLKILRTNAPREIVLEIVDNGGRSLWRFPQITALNDLLATVKYQVSDVKNVLDSLIRDAKQAVGD